MNTRNTWQLSSTANFINLESKRGLVNFYDRFGCELGTIYMPFDCIEKVQQSNQDSIIIELEDHTSATRSFIQLDTQSDKLTVIRAMLDCLKIELYEMDNQIQTIRNILDR